MTNSAPPAAPPGRGPWPRDLVLAGIAGAAVLAAGGSASAQQAARTPLRELDTSAVPALDQAGLLRVQQLLKARGFDPVRVDGIMGPLTRTAVGGFQERYGIRPRAEIDNQTLLALGAVDLAGPGSR